MALGQNESSGGQLVSLHSAREGLEQQERQDTATAPLRAHPESSLAALSLPTSSSGPDLWAVGPRLPLHPPSSSKGSKI